ALVDMTGNGPGTPRWQQGRLRFHELVLYGGENEILGALWPSIQVILQWLNSFRTSGDLVSSDDEAVSVYASALARIAQGDAEGAMVAMAHVIDLNLDEALNLLLRAGSSPPKADRSVENASRAIPKDAPGVPADDIV